MEVKKNILGIKMGVLLLLLLLNLFVFCTSSYASITEEYILYSLQNGNFSRVYTGFTSVENYKQLYNRIDINELTLLINNDIENLGFSNPHDYNISCFFVYTNSPVYYNIYFAFHNNSRNTYNNLGYLEINQSSGLANLKSHNDEPIYILNYYYDNNYIFSSKQVITVENTIYTAGNITISNIENLSIFNQNLFTTTNLSEYFITYPSGSIDVYSCYLKMDNNWFETVNDNPIIPDEPSESGDSGGSGTTGTITNPSGDTTGKVDLSGIEQGIGAVKDAVNNVTNTIKDAFTFDSGDAQEVMQEFENTDLGLSQDLYYLNNQFFELFETEEMDDFKISWSGVNYQEAQLIPSGEVNFSAICRENQQIGKVKDYITLFAIVGASFTLLKVIWNMIAEMLGLNQTLMETDFGDSVMYTYEDNGYDTDTRAYLDHHYYTKGGRRH